MVLDSKEKQAATSESTFSHCCIELRSYKIHSIIACNQESTEAINNEILAKSELSLLYWFQSTLTGTNYCIKI